MSTSPPVDATDPGFKQTNTKVGAGDEFTLPDVVPIVSPTHTSRVGLIAQEVWLRVNWLARGIAGTMVQWFVFFAEVGKAYPLPAYSTALVFLTTVQEKYSEEPILANTIRYMMTSYDPKAAEMIFAPPEDEGDPVRLAGRKATEEATRKYLESPEYQDLKDEIELDVQMQVRRQAYAAAGMAEEVKEVDKEIAALRAARPAEREREEVVQKAPPEDPPKVIQEEAAIEATFSQDP